MYKTHRIKTYNDVKTFDNVKTYNDLNSDDQKCFVLKKWQMSREEIKHSVIWFCPKKGGALFDIVLIF